MQFIFEKMNSYPQMTIVIPLTIVLSIVILGTLILGYLDHKSDIKLQKSLEDCLQENIKIKNNLYAKEDGKISGIDEIEDTSYTEDNYVADDESNLDDIGEEKIYDTGDDDNDEFANR